MFLKSILFSLLGLTSAMDTSQSIDDTRATCEQLTNESITEVQGFAVGKRKDHLLIHVRKLCEDLESLYDEGQWPSLLVTLKQQELNLILESWVHKFKSEQGVGMIDIALMGLSHDLSPWKLRFKIPNESKVLIENPQDSIYWKQKNSFEEQAKYLQVDPKVEILQLKELEAKGSAPKAQVIDLKSGKKWLMRWGDEIHTDAVASRLFASLGYNVDLPYFFGPGKVTLLLGDLANKKSRTVQHFVRFIFNAYGINLSPFILKAGKINNALVKMRPELKSYKGQYFVQFKATALEARSEKELRLGGIMSSNDLNSKRRELRGALLAHLWLGTWDTKEDNTLLSIVMDDKRKTELRASYSDLGVSLGVSISKFPRDFKAGLVNHFGWNLVEIKNSELRFNSRMNHFSKAYESATYEDLKWMAIQISKINEAIIRNALSASGWPDYLQELYFQKLAERRRQILNAFEINDPNPISINRNYSYQNVIKNGELITEPSLQEYPEGLLHEKGRIRGFGW